MNAFKRKVGPFTTGLLLAAGLLLGTTASAMPPDKVDVCHVPANTPENYKLRSFADKGGAVANHLLHGDWLVTEPICEDAIDDNNCDGVADDPNALNYDCVIQTGNADATCENRVCIEPDPAIARAFIDVDPADGSAFNPAKDIIIAELLDTDSPLDGLTVGDTLRFGQYPTTDNSCPSGDCTGNLGTFSNTTHTVSSVSSVTSTVRRFTIATDCPHTFQPSEPCVVTFQRFTDGRSGFELFSVEHPDDIGLSSISYYFLDALGTAANNRIFVTTTDDPADADAAVDLSLGTGATDYPYIDVIIY